MVGLLQVMERRKTEYERAEFELDVLTRRLERRLIVEKGLTPQDMADMAVLVKRIDASLDAGPNPPPDVTRTAIDALVNKELQK